MCPRKYFDYASLLKMLNSPSALPFLEHSKFRPAWRGRNCQTTNWMCLHGALEMHRKVV
jgi:hypothetical protein